MPWIVLPVRGEAAGKSRLNPALEGSARMRLNRRLLRRTLAVIAAWQGSLERCIVISPCARSLAIARRRGARALLEPAPRMGLNRAVAHAVKQAQRNGARRVLIVPTDLACVTPAALRRIGAHPRAAIAPDRTGTGTNALLLPLSSRFPFAYGPDSFARHRAALRARGWDAVCTDPLLRFDLDTPQDLHALAALVSRGPRAGRVV